VVGNGREAVETALARDFDLVLMDIQMPLLDGMQATQILRSAGYAGPIVALTANVMKADVQRYLESGCNDVLAKPVERERFYDVIATQLAGGTAQRKAVDDDGFEREMVSLTAAFRARLPSQIDAIRVALARADWDALRALIHVLKGSAGSYGFGHLTDLSAQIEGELAAGRTAAAARLCESLIAEAADNERPLRRSWTSKSPAISSSPC
jgi:CheY-like chemotaxis protein